MAARRPRGCAPIAGPRSSRSAKQSRSVRATFDPVNQTPPKQILVPAPAAGPQQNPPAETPITTCRVGPGLTAGTCFLGSSTRRNGRKRLDCPNWRCYNPGASGRLRKWRNWQTFTPRTGGKRLRGVWRNPLGGHWVRGSGGIGRRARLRGVWRNPWGFKSPLPHGEAPSELRLRWRLFRGSTTYVRRHLPGPPAAVLQRPRQ